MAQRITGESAASRQATSSVRRPAEWIALSASASASTSRSSKDRAVKMPAQQLTDSRSAKQAKIVSMPYNHPSSQALIQAKGSNDFSDVDLAAGLMSPTFVKGRKGSAGSNEPGSVVGGASRSPHRITKWQWITVVVLFFVNLINYMDRLTIAGRE